MTKKRMLYLSPEIDDQIVARAEAQGLSVNRWLNLAIAHALSGEHAIEITETTTMKAVL